MIHRAKRRSITRRDNLTILKKFLLLMFLLQAVACKNNLTKNVTEHSKADSVYMRTGFYFLADSVTGIKMQRHKSNEFFYLDQSPFASVYNIKESALEKYELDKSLQTRLCLEFDAKGKKDFAEGSANPLHPSIAVVIANKLLYVVGGNPGVTSGIVYLYFDSYSEQEISDMQKAIEEKR